MNRKIFSKREILQGLLLRMLSVHLLWEDRALAIIGMKGQKYLIKFKSTETLKIKILEKNRRIKMLMMTSGKNYQVSCKNMS